MVAHGVPKYRVGGTQRCVEPGRRQGCGGRKGIQQTNARSVASSSPRSGYRHRRWHRRPGAEEVLRAPTPGRGEHQPPLPIPCGNPPGSLGQQEPGRTSIGWDVSPSTGRVSAPWDAHDRPAPSHGTHPPRKPSGYQWCPPCRTRQSSHGPSGGTSRPVETHHPAPRARRTTAGRHAQGRQRPSVTPMSLLGTRREPGTLSQRLRAKAVPAKGRPAPANPSGPKINGSSSGRVGCCPHTVPDGKWAALLPQHPVTG